LRNGEQAASPLAVVVAVPMVVVVAAGEEAMVLVVMVVMVMMMVVVMVVVVLTVVAAVYTAMVDAVVAESMPTREMVSRSHTARYSQRQANLAIPIRLRGCANHPVRPLARNIT
jgi:hypothetical protein